VQLCGRLVVVLEGRRIEQELPSRQGRMLFAYLVTRRHSHTTRSQLAEALWPETGLASADSSLKALLSKLRKVVGADVLVGRDELRLELPPGSFVDIEAASEKLHEAESAVAASDWTRAWAPARTALHTATRGFMRGVDAPWIEEVRRELEEVRVRALECVAAVGVGLGGPELASTERAARTLVEIAPFRESGYLHLMRALAAQDNVAEAVRVHERLRCLLRDELGTTPSASVRAIYEELVAE
jgi:SARP family transcriptional regulator, regulator of embCAB operon